ncbi:MAG: hypothetical protein KU38_07530 [Sulfurovum sp. FS08-3]|nr:MAG: hypothetical protein KU38_07530 [Sulfurovum sp. FS08-3]
MNELAHILIRAKKDIYRYLSGSNLSRFLGHGYDFAELVEYRIGDDIRDISWISSAKRGEIYVKKMHEEKDLSIVCVAMVEGRMAVGNKYETLLQTVASMGYIAHYQHNLFGGYYTIKGALQRVEPSKSHQTVEYFVEQLYSQNPLGQSLEYQSVLEYLMEHLHSKALVVVVGDFLDDVDLARLAYKHEVIAIVVRSIDEEIPPYQSDVELIDPTTNQASSKILTPNAIKYYQKKLQQHDAKLTQHFNGHGIRFIKIYHPDEIVERLGKVLA